MTTTTFLSTQGVISFLITNSQNESILIDPSYEMAQKIVSTIKQKNLILKYVLDTHTHADYFSSRALFKALYPDVKVGLSEFSPTKDNELKLKDNDILEIQDIKLTAWQAHGHTNESMIFVVENEDKITVFSGDTLFIGGTGRSDFQLGDSQLLYASLERILSLPENTVVYPGHNYQGQVKTTIAVEKITNPRFKLVVEGKKAEFVSLMQAHQPVKPELFEESLAWNSI